MRGANAKFERRFAHIETRLAEAGRVPEGATLDEMEGLWAEAKAESGSLPNKRCGYKVRSLDRQAGGKPPSVTGRQVRGSTASADTTSARDFYK